jgi:hypothetical protein
MEELTNKVFKYLESNQSKVRHIKLINLLKKDKKIFYKNKIYH